MKSISVIALFTLFSCSAHAQTGVTSLHENFDVKCVLSSDFATAWIEYNPIIATIPMGQWTCTPDGGRPNGTATPGIMCTNIYGSTNNLDTSFLVTPLLNLMAYTGRVYFQFDTKTSIFSGGNISVFLTEDSTGISYSTASLDTDLTPYASPVFGNGDATDWVTHQVDITAFKGSPLYIAFRYAGTAATGSTWYLDNVNISADRLDVPEPGRGVLPLATVGASTENNITLSYTAATAGTYGLVVCDMMGREVLKENINAASGTQTYCIKDLGLHPGMYCIRMGNGTAFGIAKAMVQ